MSQDRLPPEERRRIALATAASDAISDVYVKRTNVIKGRVARSTEVADGVIIDFDADGNPLGVEVLDAVQTTVSARIPYEPSEDGV